MANNVMREIGIVMGTWYIDFLRRLPGNGARNGSLSGVNLDLREPPRQRRQKSFLLRLELALVFLEEERVMQQ